MEMRMKKQVLSPTVKDSEKADLSAQMLGISSDGGQGLGRGSEEDAVDEIFVLVSDGSNLFGNREDDMKIVRRQNLRRSFFDPLGTCEGLTLWTVAVAAAVVARPLVITTVAPLEMTAQSCGAAHLGRGYDAPLCGGQRRAMLLTIPAWLTRSPRTKLMTAFIRTRLRAACAGRKPRLTSTGWCFQKSTRWRSTAAN